MLNKDLPLKAYLVETELLSNRNIFPVRSDGAEAFRSAYEKENCPKCKLSLDRPIDKCYNK
jgi:hypothetical protein